CVCPLFFFSSRRRHTRSDRDWSSDVCSSDLLRDALARVAEDNFYALIEPANGGWRARWSAHSDWIDATVPFRAGPRAIEAGARRSEERRVGKEGRARRGRGQ